MGYFIQDGPAPYECTPENAWPPFCMQDLGQRFYTPALGRWLSRDPIGELAGRNPLYAFVVNDPLSLWDYLGLTSVSLDSRVENNATLVIVVEVKDLKDGCEVNFIQYRYSGVKKDYVPDAGGRLSTSVIMEEGNEVSPPRPNDPYYYDTSDPKHRPYQEAALAARGLIDGKKYDTSTHIYFSDAPPADQDLYFYLMVVEVCCPSSVSDVITVLAERQWSLTKKGVTIRPPDSQTDRRNLSRIKAKINDRVYRRVNPDATDWSDAFLDVDLTIE